MNIVRVSFKCDINKPVLCKESVPVYLPFKYNILSLKNKSYKTQYNYMHSIKILFEFFEDQKINLQLEILKSNFSLILGKIDSLTMYLETKESKTKDASNPNSFLTKNNHLCRMRNFLEWCNLYFNNSSNDENRQIESIFNSHIVSFGYNSSYTSLEKKDIKNILDLAHPHSENNPFVKKNRVRNFVIILLLSETGLRLSELLKIKTDDFIRDGRKIYLRIVNRNIDKEDTRKNPPSLKNYYGIRTVGISQGTYELIDLYIQQHRKKNQHHSYLFTSDINGNPLAKNSVSNIFHIISIKLNLKFTPHVLRHFFSETMLEFLIEIKKIDMERAKDELRIICGWSINSNMPNLYTKNYISKLANNHNQERITCVNS
ncbi:tyrosine-type recombinase/integrase [Autumnicola musiva]|uniref:Site-specific integrase n=1 Tax=Autumnicola musiva TaxID=3075589 RepID=A0ABU3D630_9FLAO|nr:site-specific integrase [Zunongwangia sp. F117]MDT0676990.1 site-specific integrase [Zunongwangia sp. F117]